MSQTNAHIQVNIAGRIDPNKTYELRINTNKKPIAVVQGRQKIEMEAIKNRKPMVSITGPENDGCPIYGAMMFARPVQNLE